jgi:hypothetical protein
MRRQSPRDSPNCTRELGPIAATRRERLLGSARTTTQFLETELTQRDARRDFEAAVGAAARAAADPFGVTRAIAPVEPGSVVPDLMEDGTDGRERAGPLGGGVATTALGVGVTATGSFARGGDAEAGTTSPIGAALVTVSRLTLSAAAFTADASAVSAIANFVVDATVSTAARVECAFVADFVRLVAPSNGSSLRRRYPVPTTSTKAATPMPRQTCGPIGARSGFVPHHLHSPKFSG